VGLVAFVFTELAMDLGGEFCGGKVVSRCLVEEGAPRDGKLTIFRGILGRGKPPVAEGSRLLQNGQFVGGEGHDVELVAI
jgi:hypothetical protein